MIKVERQRAGTEAEDVGEGSRSIISKVVSNSYDFTYPIAW